MTEDDMRAAIEKTARSAIFFEPIYPPSYEMKPTSFFGGQPLLPPEIEWPVQRIDIAYRRKPDAQGRDRLSAVSAPVASTFIGQIDLANLPAESDINVLPRRGTLYFFFDSATCEMDLPGKLGTG